MKKTKKQMLNIILFTLLIAIVACITVGTYAWFTDQKSFSTGELKFGTIKIDVAGDSISGDKLNVAIERSSGELTGNLMPGDKVSLKFNVALDTNSEPAYYLVFLTGAENLFDESCFYYDGTTVKSATSTNKAVGALSTTPHTFNLTKQISTSYEAQGGKVSITLEVYAIQQANLTQEQAYDELYKQYYKTNGVQLTSVETFKTALGGEDTFKTYTSIGFYKTSDFDALSDWSGCEPDPTCTTAMKASLVGEAINGDYINVYKKGTALALVSDKKIFAPTDCTNMFNNAYVTTTIDVTNLDTSRTTNMEKMFNMVDGNQPKTALTNIVGLGSLDTSHVTSMQAMFQGCNCLTSLDGIQNWDTSAVESMFGMFNSCASLVSLEGIESWNVSNVKDMRRMFTNCKKLVDLGNIKNWDTRNVESMEMMFGNCQALQTLDLTGWKTGKVKSMELMFGSCQSLTSVLVSGFDTSNVTSMSRMFGACINLSELDVSSFNTSNVTNMSYMFYQCYKLSRLDVSSFNTHSVTDMKYMFLGLGLKSSSSEMVINGLASFDTSNVLTIAGMFCNGENFTGSGKLTNETLAGITNWNVGKVKDMTCMFYGQGRNLTTLDLSGWDTSNCESFNHLFADCRKLNTLNLTNWNTQSLRTSVNMFNDCWKLTSVGDISHWNTSNLYDCGNMFTSCLSLTKIDLSGWDTSNVRGMAKVFVNCTKLTSIDISSWSNENVIGGITAETVKTWPSTVTDRDIYYAHSDEETPCEGMFSKCSALTVIYVNANWDQTKCGSSAFTDCAISSVTVK